VLYAPPRVEDFPTDTVSAMLEYYSDKKLHNKSGSIDLNTCEEVYSALDSETYKHVFCIQVHFRGFILYILIIKPISFTSDIVYGAVIMVEPAFQTL